LSTMTDFPALLQIGADTGGTFTDVVALDAAGRVWTHKHLSTPPAFDQAVLRSVELLLGTLGVPGASVSALAHGTTVATNAVLEHRGARTALITTRGFRDVLELRRIRAPQIYDLFFDKPKPLVERDLRFELTERVDAAGKVLLAVATTELELIARALERERVESVAVCLLHSYAAPEHERQVGTFLAKRLPGLGVSLSCDVLRERGEYERTATVVVNAYVRPVMDHYLRALRDGLARQSVQAPLLIMQSAGGLTPADDAAMRPVFILESGPAAGVLAAQRTAVRAGLENVITLDVGGTTAKASLIENGAIRHSSTYEVGSTLSAGNRLVGGGGDIIGCPTIDIAEVGAGGGSIAYLDTAGGLRVGPRSAGAVPGPACYGRGGTEPTVTDAGVVLGYIRAGRLADGEISVDVEVARRVVFDRIARPLGLDLLRAAEGIYRIANARTLRALRAVSTERGRDPRAFALLAFGGAGPIHAAALAEELHLARVIIPPLPGLFSALGLLLAGIVHHDARSCLFPCAEVSAEELTRIRADLGAGLLRQFESEGIAAADVNLRFSADIRYRSQAGVLRIPLPEGACGLETLRAAFEEEHARFYGHQAEPNTPVDVTAVRLLGQAGGAEERQTLRPVGSYDPPAPVRQAYFGPELGLVETPVLSRAALEGARVGPLLIDEHDSTTVVPPSMRVFRDRYGNLVLEPRRG
jgi:N-methylhydantoinase A